MNIKVQCCGIVLVALIIIIYHRRRSLQLIISKVFQASCYATLACLILDVASIFGIVYRASLPAFLPPLICKTYVAFLVVVSMLATIYVATGVSLHLPYYKKMTVAYVVLGAIIIGLIYALPISLYEDVEKGLAWTSGPSTTATYIGAAIFIALNLMQIFRHRKYLYDRQREMVLLWMFIWVAAAVVQAFFNQLLLVGFACSLSMLLLFIQFENPELYLDRTSGLFNYMAYARYGEQLYCGRKDFYAIAVTFENTARQDLLQGAVRDTESQKIYNVFLTIPGAKVFKIQENEVLLFFNKEEDKKSAWNDMLKQAKPEYVDSMLGRPSFYDIADPRCVYSHGELLELLRYAIRQHSNAVDGVFHVIDVDTASQILADHEMEQMITDALNEDRVVVHYQPIYSVEKKCFTSAEALVRIVDREGNLIPPGAFIRAAENNGLIIEIGKRVFEKACRFFCENQLEERGIEYIEVNLSVMQCIDDKLADDYIHILQTAQMDPRRVNLEITESSTIHGTRTMIANMDRMISYGVNFSLDDFGTGASNLNYIVDMPVKIVKFDKGMIQSYFSNGKAKYVMDAAMHMIHGMGLKIVAEGVETEEQYRKMEEIKINFIQGFYFSKPLPEQEFLEFLSRENVSA